MGCACSDTGTIGSGSISDPLEIVVYPPSVNGGTSTSTTTTTTTTGCPPTGTCCRGYGLLDTLANFTVVHAPLSVANSTMQAQDAFCAIEVGHWLYFPALGPFGYPFGILQVTGISGNQISYRNINIAQNTAIVAGTKFFPGPPDRFVAACQNIQNTCCPPADGVADGQFFVCSGGTLKPYSGGGMVGRNAIVSYYGNPLTNGAVSASNTGYLFNATSGWYGWALCQGGIVNIPAAFQASVGAATFTTPDLRDKWLAGAGGAYSPAATFGEATHILTVAELPAGNLDLSGVTISAVGDHTHSIPQDADIADTQAGTGADRVEAATTPLSSGPGGAHTHTLGGTIPLGSGTAHENRPPSMANWWVIRVW
jgi:microcystin-dependent protein